MHLVDFIKYVEKTRQKAEALNYMAKEAGIYKTELQYDTKAGKFKRKLYLKDKNGNEPREGVIESLALVRIRYRYCTRNARLPC